MNIKYNILLWTYFQQNLRVLINFINIIVYENERFIKYLFVIFKFLL